MNRITVTSARLRITSRSVAEMEEVWQSETDAEMKRAYLEMLEAMKSHPAREELCCDWRMAFPDGTVIGGIGFKGPPDESGYVDIGYAVEPAHQRRGYATEAVAALSMWALSQPDIRGVTAQTDPGNAISQRVLLKNGFVPHGMGTEGPMFLKRA